jgi:Helix-turn-helix domain
MECGHETATSHYYSAAQRSEIWDRWQAGEPMSSIGRGFDRESSSVFSVISPTGGIRPPDRCRAKDKLSLSEREEISRWLSMRCSLRSIARHLGRSASTISREVQRNGGALVPAALALLPHRQTGREFLFGDGPRRSGDPPRGFSGWSKSKTALNARIAKALGEPLPHWTVHDLRRSASTMMADQLGVLPHIVEAILNHVSGHRAGVAGVYNRARYATEMREALQRWAQHVAALTVQKVGKVAA